MKFLAALSTGLLLAAYSLPALASDAELKLDVNEDGVTDELDVAAIHAGFSYSWQSGRYDESLDYDKDGEVDQVDINIWRDEVATYSAPEPVYTPPAETPAPDDSTASGESSTSGSDAPVETPVVETPVVDTGNSSGDSTGSNAEAQGSDISAFDINGDGVLDSSDSSYYESSIGAKKGRDKHYVEIADVDGSGKITIVDAIKYRNEVEDAGLDFSGQSQSDEAADEETQPEVIAPEPPVEDVAQEEEPSDTIDPAPPVDEVEVVEEVEEPITEPVHSGADDPSFRTNDLAASPNAEFAAVVGFGGDSWLHLFDTSNETVTHAGNLATAGFYSADRIVLRDTLAYAIVLTDDRTGLLCVVDISDITNPQLVSTPCTKIGGEKVLAGGLALDGDYAYVVTEGQVDILDVSSPNRPLVVSTIATRTTEAGADAVVANGYLYAVSRDQFLAFDVSDPRRPSGELYAFSMYKGRRVFLDDATNELVILNSNNIARYDISNGVPKYLGQTVGDSVTDIDVYNGEIFSAKLLVFRLGKVGVIQVTSSENPKDIIEEIDTLDLPGSITTESGVIFVTGIRLTLEAFYPAK